MTAPAPSPLPALTVDTLGRKCPVPIIMLARRNPGSAIGSVVSVHADDPAARTDVPAWCGMKSQEFVVEEGAAARLGVPGAPQLLTWGRRGVNLAVNLGSDSHQGRSEPAGPARWRGCPLTRATERPPPPPGCGRVVAAASAAAASLASSSASMTAASLSSSLIMWSELRGQEGQPHQVAEDPQRPAAEHLVEPQRRDPRAAPARGSRRRR